MLIGITGTIGSGKSVVARMLGELLPAPVFSSDEICRQLLEKGEEGYRKMITIWGNRYLDKSGEVDRPKLRTALFADRQVRTALEEILHPLVRLKLLEAKQKGGDATLLVAEVPLLFECGWESDFDYIVCVTADPEQTRQRVAERDAINPAAVEQIIGVQMDSGLKAQRSDRVIDNSGSLEQTRAQVAQLAAELRQWPATNKTD